MKQLQVLPAPVRDMYKDVEPKLEKYIRKRARMLNGTVDVDDAVQEMRKAIMMAMCKYDFAKANGELGPYLQRVVKHTGYSLWNKSQSLKNIPHAKGRNAEGETVVERYPLVHALPDGTQAIELGSNPPKAHELVEDIEAEERANDFRERLMARLGERERELLRLRLEPPDNIPSEGDEPSHVEIAAYMGLTKNQADWSLHRIREAATEVIESDPEGISDVVQGFVERSGWPEVHTKRSPEYSREFVEAIAAESDLDLDSPLDQEWKHCPKGSRYVEKHAWGAVVYVSRAGRGWTSVVRGRFNVPTGTVYGDCGAVKHIDIEGYSTLAKALNKV